MTRNNYQRKLRGNIKLLKRFISYYKPHKRLFFIDMIFAFLISISDLVFPVFTRKMINEIIPEGRMDLLVKWTIIMILLFSLRYVSNFIVAYWGHLLGVRIEHDMRKDIFSHLQTFLKLYSNILLHY